MSKEIAQTVGGRKIAWLIAIVAAFAALATVWPQVHRVRAADPVAVLSFAKSAQVDGNRVAFTLTVQNSGLAPSDSQTAQDTLPAGGDWFIVSDSMGCDLTTSALAGRMLLNCGPFIVPPRHINEAGDDFENGVNQVTVSAVLECGTYRNTATFNFVEQRSSTVSIPCPETPTPTPTQAPPTPTATATPPPPTATATVPAATVSPTRNVPLPPNTGDSAPHESTTTVSWLYAVLGFAALVFAVGGYIIARRNRLDGFNRRE